LRVVTAHGEEETIASVHNMLMDHDGDGEQIIIFAEVGEIRYVTAVCVCDMGDGGQIIIFTGHRIIKSESNPYLGGALQSHVCSHGGSDTPLSGSRLASLSPRLIFGYDCRPRLQNPVNCFKRIADLDCKILLVVQKCRPSSSTNHFPLSNKPMATFFSGYIKDLSPVKDNIKLRVRILRAWLQPLYNNQQIKNMEMIVMDDHMLLVKLLRVRISTIMTKIEKQEKNQSHSLMMRAIRLNARCEAIMPNNLMTFQILAMTTAGLFWYCTKLYLFDGNKAIYEDEYKEVEEFRQRLFANQPSEQSKNTATKISTASKNSTKDTFVNKHPIRNIAELLDVEQGVQCVIVGTVIAIQEDEGWWYLGCRACRGKDETGTISLSLFNDEVQAMVGRSAYQLCEKYTKSESDGFIPTEITNLISNKYAFKVAIDDYNVKKLLLIFTVLRFSNDQEIINSVLACATPIKTFRSQDNEATNNTVPTITSLSQTDESTTPNEKQKTNKRPAEGEPGSESSTGKKKAVEIKV
nr:hypothetical protein [Tanacetum cinerariifolium]